jgi:hypothetical protein
MEKGVIFFEGLFIGGGCYFFSGLFLFGVNGDNIYTWSKSETFDQVVNEKDLK